MLISQIGIECLTIYYIRLQEERKEHARTRSALQEVTDRLEFALGEVEVLTKQLAREKEAFQRA